MNYFYVILTVCAPILITFINAIASQGTDESNIRVQPELDRINILEYLSNEQRLKLQLKCVLFDGPCDAVGHWIKPRVKAALLGECLKCTDIQKGWLNTWMGIFTDDFPELYRAAIAKYIEGQGIAVSDQDKNLAQNLFSAEGWQAYSAKVKKVIAEMKNKSNLSDSPSSRHSRATD